MKFNKKEFMEFCKDLMVDTKEFGVVSLGKVMRGTQIHFIDEIAKGLEEGIHFFVVLKGRQVMISTICLALDLYWSFKFAGVQGTLITDTEENRDMFRETLTMYMESLPDKWKQPLIKHNRTQLTFRNRSRFMYQVAGVKKREKRGVGIGKAVMMAHLTEVSNYGDEGAFADIEASFAQKNPKRLYIFESTARGPNTFMDMWENAQKSRSQRAIFIGWWRNDLYRCKKGSPEYNVYWDGQLTSEEVNWTDEVKSLYDYEITDEQIAWWRYTLNEHQRDMTMMLQNFPPTETLAFQMSGSQFFSSSQLTDRMKIARAKPFDAYNFVFGLTFEDTKLVDADPVRANLKIWEHPKPNSYYALGADPAWGSSEWADRHCVQVYRCYADGLDQVAEFNTSDGVTDEFAWVLLYLAGAYSQGLINLEVNGPGMAVWQEILTLKRLSGTEIGRVAPNIAAVIMNIQNHLYRRPDTLQGGYNFHTKTTFMEKERYMNTLRDGHESGALKIHSVECLREMKNCIRSDGELGAPGRGKDDRVIASALAAIAWKDRIQLNLAYINHTRKNAENAKEPLPQGALTKNVMNYLTVMGIDAVAKPKSLH